MPRYIVNENGEVIEEINDETAIVKVNYGDRILRKKTIDYFKDSITLKHKFVKANDLALYNTNSYAKYINKLLIFVGYMDGILKFSNGVFLKNKHISEIFEINTRNTNRVMNELAKQDIVHKHKKDKVIYYTFNPWIACRGKRIDIDLYNEFKMTEWALNSKESFGDEFKNE
jgi:hypothetical protein